MHRDQTDPNRTAHDNSTEARVAPWGSRRGGGRRSNAGFLVWLAGALLVAGLTPLGGLAAAAPFPVEATQEEAGERLAQINEAREQFPKHIRKSLAFAERAITEYARGPDGKPSQARSDAVDEELNAARGTARIVGDEFESLFRRLIAKREDEARLAESGQLLKVSFVVHPEMKVQLTDGRTLDFDEKTVPLYFRSGSVPVVAIHALKSAPVQLPGHVRPGLDQVARGEAAHSIVPIDAKGVPGVKNLGSTELFRFTLYDKTIRDMKLDSVISATAGMFGTDYVGEEFTYRRFLGFNRDLKAVYRYMMGVDHLGNYALNKEDPSKVDYNRLDTLGILGAFSGGGEQIKRAYRDPSLWQHIPRIKELEAELAALIPGYHVHDRLVQKVEVGVLNRQGYAEGPDVSGARLETPSWMKEGIKYDIIAGSRVPASSSRIRLTFENLANHLGGNHPANVKEGRPPLGGGAIPTLSWPAQELISRMVKNPGKYGGERNVPQWAKHIAFAHERLKRD